MLEQIYVEATVAFPLLVAATFALPEESSDDLTKKINGSV